MLIRVLPPTPVKEPAHCILDEVLEPNRVQISVQTQIHLAQGH